MFAKKLTKIADEEQKARIARQRESVTYQGSKEELYEILQNCAEKGKRSYILVKERPSIELDLQLQKDGFEIEPFLKYGYSAWLGTKISWS